MAMLGTLWEHFGPVFLLLLLVSQALNRRAQRIRWRNEVRSLRTSLRLGLHSLRTLYASNLTALAAGKPWLMSGRQQINLLRTQLSRLHSLDQPEIEAVMSACIEMELAESKLAICGKGIAGVSFSAPKAAEETKALETLLLQTCARIETAVDVMTPDGHTTDSAVHPQFPAAPDPANANRIAESAAP
jgi:hypothetical protein